jgi:hypothetical protein
MGFNTLAGRSLHQLGGLIHRPRLLLLLQPFGFSAPLGNERGAFVQAVDQVQEARATISGLPEQFALVGRERRAARTASCGDLRGKLDCVHTAAAERLVGVSHEPDAIVSVKNHIGRNRDPLSLVRRSRPLATPQTGLRRRHAGIKDAVRIHFNFLEAVLDGKACHFGHCLARVDIGLAGNHIYGAPEAERVDIGDIEGIRADGSDEAAQGQERSERSRNVRCHGRRDS